MTICPTKSIIKPKKKLSITGMIFKPNKISDIAPIKTVFRIVPKPIFSLSNTINIRIPTPVSITTFP
ncbi:hypothetical protein D3C73_1403050 [compost metagenome]